MHLPITVPIGDDPVTVEPFGAPQDLFDALDYEQVWTHIPRARPREATDLVDRLCGEHQQPLLIRASGRIVGSSSFILEPDDPDGVEIGATLFTPAVWGTGVNGVAKAIMIAAAFAAGSQWIQFRTDERNGRSAAAILKLPGAVESAPRLETAIIRRDGSTRTSRIFRIDRDLSRSAHPSRR